MAESVTLRQVFDDLGEFVEAYSEEISKEGMRIRTGRSCTAHAITDRAWKVLAVVSSSLRWAGQPFQWDTWTSPEMDTHVCIHSIQFGA